MADTVERTLDSTAPGALREERRPEVIAPAAPAPAPVFTARTPSGSPAPVEPSAPVQPPARSPWRRLATSPLAWTGVAATAAAAVVALAATDAPQAIPSPVAVQEVPPRPAPGPHVRTGMFMADTWSGTSTYQLRTTGPVAAATVTLVRSGNRTRVDVVTGSGPSTASATLLHTDAGWVACSTLGTSECILVAGPGAPLPAAFDPGVGALVTSALPAMAGLTSGVTVTRSLDPGADLAAAQCATVTTGPVPGEYCLTNAGLVRRAAFAGGTLDLTASTSTVDPAAFTPPAVPVPLA